MAWNFIKSLGDMLLADLKASIIGRLASVETKIDHLEGDIEEIKSDVKSLHTKVGKLGVAALEMQGIFKKAGAPIFQPLEISGGSPLKLTPYGEDVVKKVDGYRFIESNKDFLFVLVDKRQPKTAYDVQVYSRKVLEEILDNPIMNVAKSVSYKEPLDIGIILNVLGIILRDKYLEAHSEIRE